MISCNSFFYVPVRCSAYDGLYCSLLYYVIAFLPLSGDIFIYLIFSDDFKPEESILTLLCPSGIEAELTPGMHFSSHNFFILQLISL
jgi:hypothetical protein